MSVSQGRMQWTRAAHARVRKDRRDRIRTNLQGTKTEIYLIEAYAGRHVEILKIAKPPWRLQEV